jgi:biotin carboxylase
LDRCQQYRVDLFWPARGASAIATRAAEFASLGVRLIVAAAPSTLDILNDKAVFYREAQKAGEKIPLFREATSFSEFEEAVAFFLDRGLPVCFKPAKSIYGLGFKIIRDSADPLAAFLANDPVKVSLKEARRLLNVPDEKFVKLVVMEHLPGPEHSLDCLALEGRLLRVTVRKKPRQAGGPERLIKDDNLSAIAARLSDLFRLSWIYNVQLIDSQDGPRVLEINPRMAGGLYFSCLAGINYPYWAVRLALAPCEGLLPDQAYDLAVNQAYRPFIYAAS